MAVIADILIAELDAVFNIGIGIASNQAFKRSGSTIASFNLDGNKGVRVADKEVHFDSAFVVTVKIEVIAGLNKHISDDVLVNSALIGIEILVFPEVVLGFVIEGADKETGVAEIEAIIRGVVVASKRELERGIEAVAGVDDARIDKPILHADEFTVAGAFFELCNLEFFVLVAEEDGNGAVGLENLGMVETAGVFRNILLVVANDLTLGLKSAGEVLVYDIRADDGGHTAEDYIIAKMAEEGVVFDSGERLESLHFMIEVFDLGVLITECPEEFFEVEGVHVVVFFVANGVRLNLVVINPHHRTRTDDVEAAVFAEGLKSGGDGRIGL